MSATSTSTLWEILSICKGGGYKYCRTSPPHPKANSNGLYPLHRVVVENKLGRMLAAGEDVHHIDGDKDNNSADNLEVLTKSEHSSRHNQVKAKVKASCGHCGVKMLLRPHTYRLRSKRTVSGSVYCSRVCGGKAAYATSSQNRSLKT